MVIRENRYVVRAGHGDGYRAADVQSSAIEGPGQSNRVAVYRRDDIGTWGKILRSERVRCSDGDYHSQPLQSCEMAHGRCQMGSFQNRKYTRCTCRHFGWRNIALGLNDPKSGEEKAQSCDIA